MKKFFSILVLMVVLSSLIISCGGGEANDLRSQTLIVAMSSDIISMDPVAQNDVYSSNAMKQMYEGLVYLSPDGMVMPMLAEKWDISDDGMNYTFHLRKGVKFHNGEELTAEDVVFSYKRAVVAPNVAHIFSDIDAESIKAVDEYTVQFSMKNPYAGIVTALCHTGGHILNKKAVEAAGDKYKNSPIGTGPYKFVSHTKSDKVKFERYEEYQGNKPYYKYLEFRIIPEPTNRIIELESGGADIVYDVSPNDLDRFTGNNDIALIRSYNYMTQYMGMNCGKAPLDNVLLRQAIACAIDTDQIVQAVWKGLGRTATGPAATTIRYSIASKLKPIPRDVEKAKRLLKEAGYEKGLKLRLSTNERKERIDMAVIMKEQLKEVGIDLSIEVLEWSKYLEMLSKGEHEIFEIGWTPDASDPDMVFYPCFHSSAIGGGANYTWCNNPELDALILKGRRMLDSPERAAVYTEIQEKMMEFTPAVFQYNGEDAVGIRKHITGLRLSPYGYHFLHTVKPEGK